MLGSVRHSMNRRGGASFSFVDGSGYGFLFRRLVLLFMRLRNGFFLSYFLAVVIVDDAGYISASLVKGRHSPVPFDAFRSRVVGSEGFDEIEIVALQQFAKITASAAYIGLGIEGIVHSQRAGGRRHELHQSTRTFRRHRVGIESAFGMNNAVHQIGIEVVGGAGGVNDVVEIESRMGRNGMAENRRGGH